MLNLNALKEQKNDPVVSVPSLAEMQDMSSLDPTSLSSCPQPQA